MDISIPSRSSIGNPIQVKCAFSAEIQILKMALLHGGSKTIATYMIVDSTFNIHPNNKITLKIEPGTTYKGGTLTFIISRVTCSDFTWYMCQTETLSGEPVSSQNITSQGKCSILLCVQTSIVVTYFWVVHSCARLFICIAHVYVNEDTHLHVYYTPPKKEFYAPGQSCASTLVSYFGRYLIYVTTLP